MMNNKSNYKNSLNSSYNNLLGINQAITAQELNQPTGYESDAELYGQLQQSTGYDKDPSNPLRALAHGFFGGARIGAKGMHNKKLEESIRKSTEFLKQVQMNAMVRIEQEEEERKKEELALQVNQKISEYIGPIYRSKASGATQDDLDRQGSLAMQALKDQNIVPQNITFDSINPKNFTMTYIKPDNSLGFIDLRKFLTKDDHLAVKQENERLNVEASLARSRAAENRANIEKEYFPRKMDLREREVQNREMNTQTRMSALGLKNVKEIIPNLRAINKGIHLADDIMQDAREHPEIFRSALSAWIKTDGNSGAFGLWVQDAMPGTAKEKDALMRVSKNLNQLMLTEVKGLGGSNNQTIDKWIKEGTLNTQYSVENVEHMLGMLKSELKFAEKMYNDVLDKTGGGFISDSYNQHKQSLDQDYKRVRNRTDNIPNGNIGPNQMRVKSLRSGAEYIITTEQYNSLSPEMKRSVEIIER